MTDTMQDKPEDEKTAKAGEVERYQELIRRVGKLLVPDAESFSAARWLSSEFIKTAAEPKRNSGFWLADVDELHARILINSERHREEIKRLKVALAAAIYFMVLFCILTAFFAYMWISARASLQ